MDIFLKAMMFIMGTFFGSFLTLAVYRIPLKKDITHERSFCPNCNHKLGFWDLIPVFSYIFLKGKCRYCGKEVRIRYLLLEILSGIVFVFVYTSLNIQNVLFINVQTEMYLLFFVFMYVTLCLIAGMDKEYKKINSSVLLFGFICHTIYILYLYIVEKTNIYRYAIYIMLFVITYIINFIMQKKKDNYVLQVILLLEYLLLVLTLKEVAFTFINALILICSIALLKKQKIKDLPIGFFFCILAIIAEIANNFIEFYFN